MTQEQEEYGKYNIVLKKEKEASALLNAQSLTQNSEGKNGRFQLYQPVIFSILFCSIIPMVRPTKYNGAKKKNLEWLFP